MKPASPPFAIGPSELNPRQGRECGYRPLRNCARIHIPIERLPVGSAGVEAGEPVEPKIERLAADGVESEEAIASPQIPSRACPAEVAVKRRNFKRLERVAWLRREKILVQESERGRRGRLQNIVPHPVERRAMGPARASCGPRIGRQPDMRGAMGCAYLPVVACGSFADAVVGNDVEIMANESSRQPQLQFQALSIAESDGNQDTPIAGGGTDPLDVAILERLTQKPPVDFPVTGTLDGMQQRLQPQPLPQVIFAQGLWHGRRGFQSDPAWQPRSPRGIFMRAPIEFFEKARMQQHPGLLITGYIQHMRLFNTTNI